MFSFFMDADCQAYGVTSNLTCSRLIPCTKIWSHFSGRTFAAIYSFEVYSIGSQIGFPLCKEGFYCIGTTYGATYILGTKIAFMHCFDLSMYDVHSYFSP